MNMIPLIALCAFLFSGQVLAGEQQEAKKDVMSQKEKASYTIGYKTGTNLKNTLKDSSMDLDIDTYVRALKEGLAGEKAEVTDREMLDILAALQKETAARRAKETAQGRAPGKKEAAEKNRREGEAFLAENQSKEGVVTLPSGLQYKVIKEGGGKTPSLQDAVTVNYRGTFINGAEFDSSYRKGKPATLPLIKVIKGWKQALQLMGEGSKWMLYIPPNLAYGPRGVSRAKVGPNQTLIFEIELISVQGQEQGDGPELASPSE